MKTYSVEVEELTYDTFEIEAESAEEAKQIVMEKLVETGELVIDCSNNYIVINNVEEVD